MHVVIVGNSAAALSALESFRGATGRRRSRSSPASRPAYSRVLLPYYLRGGLPTTACSSGRGATTRGWTRGPCSARASSGSTPRARARARRRRAWASTSCCSPPGRARRAADPGPGGSRRPRALDPGRRHAARPRCARARGSWSSAPASSRCRRPGPRTGAAPVTVVELEGRILPRVLDAAAARLLREQHLERAACTCARACAPTVSSARAASSAASPPAPTRSRSTPSSSPPAPAPTTGSCRRLSRPGTRAPGGRDHGDGGGGVFAAGDVARGPTPGGARGSPRAVADGGGAGPGGRRQSRRSRPLVRGQPEHERHRDVRADGGLAGPVRRGSGRRRGRSARPAGVGT